MGQYNIQWELVVLFVVFMATLLVFDRPKRKRGEKTKDEGKSRRRRRKRRGFRNMRSPAQRAYDRARLRQQQMDNDPSP